MSDEPQNPNLEEVQDAATVAEAETGEINDSEEPTAGDAEAQIAALEAQLVDAREQMLRSQAEAQNARRRAEQDVSKAHKFGQDKIVADLLPVVDNLERALAAIDQSDEAMKGVIEGLELTHKSFIDTLTKHNVATIDPQGEPFDPQLHQAMTMIENADVEPNTVLNVFQKGFSLNGRLVRPAMVVVAKAPQA